MLEGLGMRVDAGVGETVGVGVGSGAPAVASEGDAVDIGKDVGCWLSVEVGAADACEGVRPPANMVTARDTRPNTHRVTKVTTNSACRTRHWDLVIDTPNYSLFEVGCQSNRAVPGDMMVSPSATFPLRLPTYQVQFVEECIGDWEGAKGPQNP